MLFVAAHEMGHAAISELELQVLGREEDAADVFATIGALKVVANGFSYRVLEETAKGLFWSARRDREDGETPAYHGEHGLDEQRAYHIICLMVGSDPLKFKALADATNLPEDRRRSCVWDFETAARSWERAVAPHRRAAGQPKTPITVRYEEGDGELEILAGWFRDIRFLEIFADIFTERYAWPAPIEMEMRSCGESRARWTVPLRKLHICYEMAQEFAELYRDFGRQRKTASRRDHALGQAALAPGKAFGKHRKVSARAAEKVVR
jgi:hypothetical protein